MSTEGLFISKNKGVSGQVHGPSYTLSLLATGGDVDVLTYDISVDKPCHICPGEKPDLLEFYYVLEGAAVLKLEDGDIVLEKGEYFYVFNLKEIIIFTTQNGAKLLCVTSQPMFKYLLEYHKGLSELLLDAEAKDPYTYNHGNRVQTYSLKIGEKMGLANFELYTLQVASLFHDIGKYYVPDSILKKPGRLTDEEYACIKMHPADSGKLLKGKFEDRIITSAEQHHERLDGSGYPRGLKGEELILEARIIAVADAYDAITSNRSYRNARTPGQALEELEGLKRQYDEKVLQALREILQEEGLIGGHGE